MKNKYKEPLLEEFERRFWTPMFMIPDEPRLALIHDMQSFISQNCIAKEEAIARKLYQRGYEDAGREMVEWIGKERRIYGEKPYLWMMDEKKEFKVEDFDGTFEKQAIIGYNSALEEIINKLKNE